MKKVYSFPEAAAALGVTERTVRNMRARGQVKEARGIVLPWAPPARRRRITVDGLNRALLAAVMRVK